MNPRTASLGGTAYARGHGTAAVVDDPDHRAERRQAVPGARLAGGSRIITAVVQVTVNVIDHAMSVAYAVTAPRLHHQWMPDQVLAERGLSAETVKALEALGHKVVVGRLGTAVNAIVRGRDGGWVGAADTRIRGAVARGE
jgi:gamma-glutamyltranspeptidase/glutathione hydrolase